jgi:trehalose synthase-fused probable maltokinase
VGFAHTPALLGHIEATHRSESYALGIVHAFVPNRGDAWTWSADRINIYLNAVTEGSDERDKALTMRRDYLQWVRRMGRRVAEMHRCLASHEEIPAFKSETIDDRDLDFWINDIMNRASRVFDWLEQRSPLIDDEQDLVQSLLRTRGALPELAARLIRPSLGRRKIRHHGDLHLGQVLVAEEDAIIIDFEGEPSRSLAERRRKAPAARDVAGVMRSLDYAAMAARAQRQSLGKLEAPTMRALLTWRDQSIDAFLSGYQEAMGQSVLWPDCHDEAKNMLSFFLLEKALYEVEYELSYRPDWLAVPLQGIIRLLEEKASS